MAKCFESDFMKEINGTERKILLDNLVVYQNIGDKIINDLRMNETFRVSYLTELFKISKPSDFITIYTKNPKPYHISISDINLNIFIGIKCYQPEVDLDKFASHINSLYNSQTTELYDKIISDYHKFVEMEKLRSRLSSSNGGSSKKDEQKSAIKAAQAQLEYCKANKIIPKPEVVALARKAEEVEAKKAKKAARKARQKAEEESLLGEKEEVTIPQINEEEEEAKFQLQKSENKIPEEEIPDSWDD